jgi:multimeric flavodoxin WrbA
MILGVCGSPRDGATQYVLNQSLNQLNSGGYETIFWGVRGKRIGFCTHCDKCLEGNGCIINDDVQSLYPLFEQADAYVFATPVYHGMLSSQMKAVMDRTRGLLTRNNKAFLYKPGIAIAVGGDRAGGQELALQQIHCFYIVNGAIPLGGGSFGANLGASLWSKDSLEGVKQDHEGLRSLQMTVKRLDSYLKRGRGK